MSRTPPSRAKEGFAHESQQNLTIDWYTPSWIFDFLGLEFGLDPCAPEGGVPWIPATYHYSLKDNGLIQPWHNHIVWLNPPYGKETPDWLCRMNQHRKGIAIVFARTDCAWFHDYAANADAIYFIKGRVNFVDIFGKTGGTGTGSGSMLLAWGEESIQALCRFELLKPGKLFLCQS